MHKFSDYEEAYGKPTDVEFKHRCDFTVRSYTPEQLAQERSVIDEEAAKLEKDDNYVPYSRKLVTETGCQSLTPQKYSATEILASEKDALLIHTEFLLKLICDCRTYIARDIAAKELAEKELDLTFKTINSVEEALFTLIANERII